MKHLASATVLVLMAACNNSKDTVDTTENLTQVVEPGAITVSSLHQLASSGEDLYLLDVRTAGEYAAGRIPYVDDRIPYDSLSNNLTRLPESNETPIYCYCRSGRRSGIASKTLIEQGYTRVYNVTGGILAWKKAGYDVITD